MKNNTGAVYYSKTLKQFLADADEKKEKELIKRTLLGHKNEPQRNNNIWS